MSLPKYIINMDELASAIINPPASVSFPGDDLSKLISDFRTLLNSLIPAAALSGSHRSVGLHLYIPALAFDFDLSHVFSDDVLLTGISYSQSGWKPSDRFSLFAGDVLIFDGLFTKELGQYFHLNTFFPVSAGCAVKFVHHNRSGNSKQIWFDIHYLLL